MVLISQALLLRAAVKGQDNIPTPKEGPYKLLFIELYYRYHFKIFPFLPDYTIEYLSFLYVSLCLGSF